MDTPDYTTEERIALVDAFNDAIKVLKQQIF